MYKFTNGIVVFDEKTKDKYIKVGYKLVEKKEAEIITNENKVDDGIIDKQFKRGKKISK